MRKREREWPIGSYVGYDRFWGTLLAASCLVPIPVIFEDRYLWIWDLYAESDGRPKEQAWLIVSTLCGITAALVGWFGGTGRGRHAVNAILGGASCALLLVMARVTMPDLRGIPEQLEKPIPAMACGTALAYIGSGLSVANPLAWAGRLISLGGAGLMCAAFFLPIYQDVSARDASEFLWENRPETWTAYHVVVASIPAALALTAGLVVLAFLPLGAVARVRLSQLARLFVAWSFLGTPAAIAATIDNFGGDWRSFAAPMWLFLRMIAPAFITVDALTTIGGLSLGRRG